MVTRTGVISDNDTNLSLQINNITDDGKRTVSAKPIRSRGGLIWGDNNSLWGDDTIVWGLDGVIDEWRRVGSSALRCNYHQVQLTNAYVAIYNSDSLDTADVDANTSTATLTDTASFDWPDNVVDYYIAFDDDSYVQEYLITARTADTITFSDGGNNALDGTATGWVIRGKPKGEILSLISFTLHYEVFGRTQGFYSGAAVATGENS